MGRMVVVMGTALPEPGCGETGRTQTEPEERRSSWLWPLERVLASRLSFARGPGQAGLTARIDRAVTGPA